MAKLEELEEPIELNEIIETEVKDEPTEVKKEESKEKV